MKDCKTCKLIPVILGKKLIMPILKHNYKKIFLEDTQKHFFGLNLEIVGGLARNGWTTNDIDVIGNKKDIYIYYQVD